MTQDAHQDEVAGPAGSDDALAPVRALDDVPTSEHVQRFEDVERGLRARLDGGPVVPRPSSGTEH